MRLRLRLYYIHHPAHNLGCLPVVKSCTPDKVSLFVIGAYDASMSNPSVVWFVFPCVVLRLVAPFLSYPLH